MRYRLAQPLRVKEGDYVGLTAVTWVPAFAVNLDAAGNDWLASRPKRRCATPSSSRPKRFEEYYRRNDAQLESSTAQAVPLHLPDRAPAVLGAHRAGRARRHAPDRALAASRRPGSPGRTARTAPPGCRSAAACRSAGCPRGACVPPLRRRRWRAAASGPRAAGVVGGRLVACRCARCACASPRSEEPGSGVSSGTDSAAVAAATVIARAGDHHADDQAGDDGGDAQHDQAAHGRLRDGRSSAGRRLRQYGQSLRSRPDELVAVRADAQELRGARQVRGLSEVGTSLATMSIRSPVTWS